MQYTNEMRIQVTNKENVEKVFNLVIRLFETNDFYGNYVEGLKERIINDLSVEKNEIVLGDGLEGYFDPEDSRKVFTTLFKGIASELTTIDFLAEVRNIGDYSSGVVTAQFTSGSFKIQDEYWDGFNEDGDSDLKESEYYFF